MSETAEGDAIAEDAADPVDGEVEGQADPEPVAEVRNPNAEAAKWRHKLRDEKAAHKDTRAALESVTAQVEGLQRQHIEAMLTPANVKPAALWATTDLASLLAEDGTVDPDAVKDAIVTARQTLGVSPLGTRVPNLGSRPDRLPEPDAWTGAFAPKKKPKR